jgi:hypothetical protein
MGVAVSLKPPTQHGRSQLAWIVAFAIVGVISFVSIYQETSSTDATLATLAKQVKDLQRSPRLEFGGITSKETKSGKLYSIQFHNTSDIDIVNWLLTGGLYPPEMSEKDVFNSIKTKLHDMVWGNESSTVISRGMGLGLPLNDENGLPIDLTKIYKPNSILAVIALYIGKNTERHKLWVTELCARGGAEINTYTPCSGHNDYYQIDDELKELR